MCGGQALAAKELTGGSIQEKNFEVVGTMHERKRRIAALSTKGFIVLPGG